MSRIRKQKIDRLGGNNNNNNNNNTKKQRTVDLSWKADENIDSDEDDYDNDQNAGGLGRINDNNDEEESVEEEEALDAKRVRLARQYLDTLEKDSDDSNSSSSDDDDDGDGDDDDDDKHDRIGAKLQKERLKREGNFERAIANKVYTSLQEIRQSLPSGHRSSTTESSSSLYTKHAKEWIDSGHVNLLRGHDLTPTCVALQSDGSMAISGSKDHSVLLWDVEQGKRSHTLCPHWKKLNSDAAGVPRTLGEVLAVACSDDGRYAAVGKRDATVSIFDVRADKNNLVKTFEGHKKAITSLAFRTQSLQLFSGSEDRCIRHYNLSEMMYLETLYGHQFGVTDIDCHRKERPISVGRDRTARAWKIAEDTHLIFRGGAKVSSADCVNVIKDDWYVTGHDDGHLGLWMTEKKRAVSNIEYAHGMDGSVGRGICSVGTLKGSDLAMSGSYDGFLRLWKASTGATLDERGLEALMEIPLEGYINGIAVGPKAKFCVVAVGQEPGMGRWNRISKAKNRFGIVSLRADGEPDEDDDDESIVMDVPTSGNNDESSSEGESESE